MNDTASGDETMSAGVRRSTSVTLNPGLLEEARELGVNASLARQFDVFHTTAGTLGVVLQSDLLKATQTRGRTAAALGRGGPPHARTEPTLDVGERPLVLMPQLAATLTISELGRPVGSLAHARDSIVRAVDVLLSGV